MKDVMRFMGDTCEQSVKDLCKVYLLLLVIQCMLDILFQTDGWLDQFLWRCILPFLVAFFLVNRIHVKRINQLVENGAIDRIRLLPVKRKSFLYSELIFTGVSYLMLIVVEQIVIATSYVLTKEFLVGFYDPFWIHVLGHEASIFFTPYSITQIMMSMITLVMFTILFTYMHLSIAIDSENAGGSIILLFIVIFMMLAYRLFGGTLLMACYLAISVYAYHQLKKAFGVRRQRK